MANKKKATQHYEHDSFAGNILHNASGSKLVVNIADFQSDDVVLYLSKAFFAEPFSITESRTDQELGAQSIDGSWVIAVPDFNNMAQVVIKFAPQE